MKSYKYFKKTTALLDGIAENEENETQSMAGVDGERSPCDALVSVNYKFGSGSV